MATGWMVEPDVLRLWQRFDVAQRTSQRKEIMEELLYTDFGPIVKYFRRELEECEIPIFEGALQKYFFPWGLRLPYPDCTYCGLCTELNHFLASVRLLRWRLAFPLIDFYHFMTPPPSPNNTRARCSHFGYYGCSHRSSVGFSSDLSVNWFLPRIEIKDSNMGSILEEYCYPYLSGRVTLSDRDINKYFPGDEIDPRSAIPDIER